MNSSRYTQLSVALIGLPIIISGLYGCTGDSSVAQQAPPSPPAVTVANPNLVPVTHFAEFSGTTRASASVEIRTRVAGMVEKVYFTPGSLVKKGDPLYLIDPLPYEARLAEAKADLAIRLAELKLAKATKQRRENAFQDKAVSEVAVIEAQANLTAAQAAVEAARATMNRAELDLSYTRINAPIDGRIGRSQIDEGNLMEDGGRTVLTTIVQANPIYAYFSINEKELLSYGDHLIKDSINREEAGGVTLQFSDGGSHPFSGYIDYLDNSLDDGTGTLQVRAVFDNSNNTLLPGLFAKVRIPLGGEVEALVVPDTALGRDQQGHFLYIADSDNVVRKQPVETGPLVDGMRVISQGITMDDRVIINGVQKARPGAPITPIETEQLSSVPSDITEPSV